MNKTIAAFSLMCAVPLLAEGVPFLLNVEVFACKENSYTVNAYPLPIAGRQCNGQTINWVINPRISYEILGNGVIQIIDPDPGVYYIQASSEGVGCAGFTNLVVN